MYVICVMMLTKKIVSVFIKSRRLEEVENNLAILFFLHLPHPHQHLTPPLSLKKNAKKKMHVLCSLCIGLVYCIFYTGGKNSRMCEMAKFNWIIISTGLLISNIFY